MCQVLESRGDTAQLVVVSLQHPQVCEGGECVIGQQGQLVIAQVPGELGLVTRVYTVLTVSPEWRLLSTLLVGSP